MSEERAGSPSGAPIDGYNAGYAEELYERRLRERGAVPPSLAEWMENGREGLAVGRGEPPAGPAGEAVAEPGAPTAEIQRLAATAGELVAAHRDHGHLAARVDPFGRPPPGHPLLEPEFYGVTEERLAGVSAAAVGLERHGEAMDEVLRRLREIYGGPIGYELDHIDEPEKREWLIERIESGEHRPELTGERARRLLERLSEVEGLERFLHRAYMGKKRFSVEGVDMLVPMLDEIFGRSAGGGAGEVILGMAHRGRLNVLAHIVGRPYRAILAEFEGEHQNGVGDLVVPEEGAGDVKYHLGAAGVLETEDGPLGVYLAPNPSHLEHVNPVVQGMARAARELRARGERRRGEGELPGPSGEDVDRTTVLPVLIHGDAAFMGQGVVAETLNLHGLEGYETGGTIHLIANNQLGFTTEPEEGRSTHYASDLALGFRVPVIHVNADDPEACLAAARLASDYRREFGEDILIDLVGYRRHGHNEGDEPAYTQPGLYERIDDHPTVREAWADRLREEGIVTAEEADAMADRVAERLAEARESVAEARESVAGETGEEKREAGEAARETTDRPPPNALRAGLTSLEEEELPETGVEEERLRRLHEELHTWPDDLEVLDKLERQLLQRRDSLESGEPLDWAHAEALALASLLVDGVAVRLTGEDTVRGTFSQRHLRLRDASGEGSYVPLANLSGATAPFQAHNSPLSEVSTLGFEYGYSAIATESLVLWEAQFGDFVNVGQAIIDQFLVAGRSKWGQESRLALLLPHAYEGQGPEHSSARLERFLQLGGRGNIRVAYPTTPAQYFHLLRTQALRTTRRPLIVMTPKSLLRHPRARSSLEHLASGAFRPVLFGPAGEAASGGVPDSGGDPAAVGTEDAEGSPAGGAPRDGVRLLLLCTGKVYYDLLEAEEERREAAETAGETALARIEFLYPFPADSMGATLASLPDLEEVVWVQEEPANMGAWNHIRPRLRELLATRADEVTLRYVGRPEMASPSEGYAAQHAREQRRIVREAYGLDGDG